MRSFRASSPRTWLAHPNRLIDLSTDEPKKGELSYFLGPARITVMKAALTPVSTGLGAGECSTIAAVRAAQESILKVFDPNAETIVLTFAANHLAFASIGSLKSVNQSWLSSYHNEESFGILCTLESTHGGVVFLDPLWIW